VVWRNSCRAACNAGEKVAFYQSHLCIHAIVFTKTGSDKHRDNSKTDRFLRQPCVIRSGIFPSAGGLADCDGCGGGGDSSDRPLTRWGRRAALREALGPEASVRPLTPRRRYAEGVSEAEAPAEAAGATRVETFSQHQNENVDMSVVEFQQKVAAGERLQLRMTLAEWGERNATKGDWAPPSPLRRGDCCMSHHGLFFEQPSTDDNRGGGGGGGGGGAEDAEWVRSKPSGLWFSSLGSRTPLHNDPSDSFLAQLAGEKSLIILPGPPSVELSPLVLRLIGAENVLLRAHFVLCTRT
jgi:hypothetical protein